MSAFLIALIVTTVVILAILFTANMSIKKINQSGTKIEIVCENPLCKNKDVREIFHNIDSEEVVELLECPECKKTRQIIT